MYYIVSSVRFYIVISTSMFIIKKTIKIKNKAMNFFSFSVNTSFSERFPEKCSMFYSHVGHYKEKFESSFPSQKYWSCVTCIDCKCWHKAILVSNIAVWFSLAKICYSKLFLPIQL